MLISVINHSSKPDAEVQAAARAINRQIAEDFEPYWSFGAQLRLEGAIGKRPSPARLGDMRGDAVLYVLEHTTAKDAFGWHTSNFQDIPYGCVFLELCVAFDEPWTVTLSHEALELVGDPLSNLLVQGPSPRDRRHQVFHMFEMCDAVQDERYLVDGVAVSNFVLPSYFTPGEQDGRRNDFLGNRHGENTLRSFDVNPGGYVNYFDPKERKWMDYVPDNERAQKRHREKQTFHAGRSFARRHPEMFRRPDV